MQLQWWLCWWCTKLTAPLYDWSSEQWATVLRCSSRLLRPVSPGQPGSPGTHYDSITPGTAKNTRITFHYSWHCQPHVWFTTGNQNPQSGINWIISTPLHNMSLPRMPSKHSISLMEVRSQLCILLVIFSQKTTIYMATPHLTLAPSSLYFQCFTTLDNAS